MKLNDMDQHQRVLLVGATGTAGQAALRAVLARGHDVLCLVRRLPDDPVDGATYREMTSFAPETLAAALAETRIDTVMSCLASRTGTAKDAWAVDYQAHVNLLEAARACGAARFVLLSAICVQKPELAFQHAKRAFEEKLIASGLTYVIVRPTAFFKSLSGQIDRVRRGKPYLLFGDGTLTACKPISDDDLGAFLAQSLTDPDKQNRILPIGGPGGAITPRDQADALFRLAGMPPRYKRVPVALFKVIGGALRVPALFSARLADKAALARIGRYYATESMLVWDAEKQRYDADATPETGADTLFDHYARLIAQGDSDDLGAHSVF